MVAFAGCLDDSSSGVDGSPDSSGEASGGGFQDESLAQKPEKRWEPKVIFEPEASVIEPGVEFDFHFDITDKEDYEYPTDFLDWQLEHEFTPDPLDEGDATMLPSAYNTTLYKVGFHNFTFTIQDGQGFNHEVKKLIQVGEPCEVFDPYTTWGCPEFGGVPELTLLSNLHTAVTTDGCYACVDGWNPVTGYPGASGCGSFRTKAGGEDCVWVPISSNSWGESFSVTTTFIDPVSGDELRPGAPDVDFTEHCRTTTSVSKEYIVEGADGGYLEGVVPEGAGCLVAFDFAWPAAIGGASAGGAGAVIKYDITWDTQPTPFPGVGPVSLYQWLNECPAYGCLISGPDDCEAMHTLQNGMGCVFFPIDKGMWGQEFLLYSSSAWAPGVGGYYRTPLVDTGDPDAKALDACNAEGSVIESFGSGGAESGTIPPGTACLMAYEWNGVPSMLSLEI